MGRAARQLYAEALKTLDVTYMRQYSPDHDLLDASCYSTALGGMAVAAKTMRGSATKVYWGESNLQEDAAIHGLADEINHLVRIKLLHPEWIAGQRSQGYQAAAALAAQINTLFRWSATTDTVAGWIFDTVVERYLEDEETLAWLRAQNPYALEEMTRRLLEAEARGLWQADAGRMAALRRVALAIEGDMEENIGEVGDGFQGGKVEIMRADDVEKWRLDWRLPTRTTESSS